LLSNSAKTPTRSFCRGRITEEGKKEEIVALKKEYLAIGLLATMVVAFVLIILIATISTRELRTPPPAITGLTATNASYDRHGQIDLAWSPSDAEDFSYYAVYASKTEITDVTELSPIDRINDRTDVTYQVTKYWADGVRLALSAFMEDTEYWFAVTAVDLDDKESNIGTIVRTTIELMPPPPSVFIKVVRSTGFGLPGFQPESFQPATITVPIGTTVGWDRHSERNSFLYSIQHTVTSDTGLFHGDLMATIKTFSYTFTEAGVFGYHCEFHDEETGTVIVE
jgi:plastocyanin